MSALARPRPGGSPASTVAGAGPNQGRARARRPPSGNLRWWLRAWQETPGRGRSPPDGVPSLRRGYRRVARPDSSIAPRTWPCTSPAGARPRRAPAPAEPFHIAQHENDAVLGRKLANRLAQPRCLFAANRERFRIDSAVGREQLELLAVRHEFFQRQLVRGSEFAPAPAHQAAAFGYLVQPHQQGLGIVELGELRNRLQQHFLHRIFGVLPLPADPHAERENGILQKAECPLQAAVIPTLQQFDGLLDFRPHGSNLTRHMSSDASTRPEGSP